MTMITLRQMQYAAALAETGHFGRAAERCHVTQPGLSQQIRQLEDMCGAALFDRLGKSVRLTPLGREFVERTRPILQQTQALESFLAGHGGRPTRPLRFGLIPTVAPYLLPDIFPALQTGLPDIHFSIVENRTEALISGLDDGTLDLALIASEPREGWPRMTSRPLFPDDFVLATGTDQPAGTPVRLHAIDKDRMLLLDEGHCFRDQTIAVCGLDAEASRRTFAATSLSTIVEFVAAGQGITLLPQIAVRKEAAGGRIAIHRLASPGAMRLLSLVWRQGSPFADLFADVAETISRARPAIIQPA